MHFTSHERRTMKKGAERSHPSSITEDAVVIITAETESTQDFTYPYPAEALIIV